MEYVNASMVYDVQNHIIESKSETQTSIRFK